MQIDFTGCGNVVELFKTKTKMILNNNLKRSKNGKFKNYDDDTNDVFNDNVYY